MKFTVYILFSKSTSKFYTGSTQDIENRIVEHNQGETKSIKHGTPWEVIWQTHLPTRAEAIQLENKIKKRGAKRFIDDQSRGAWGAKVVRYKIPNPHKKALQFARLFYFCCYSF